MKNPSHIVIGEKQNSFGITHYSICGDGTMSYLKKNNAQDGEVVHNKLRFVEIVQDFRTDGKAKAIEKKSLVASFETENNKLVLIRISNQDISSILNTLLQSKESSPYFSVIYIKNDYKVIPYHLLNEEIEIYTKHKNKQEEFKFNLSGTYKEFDIFVNEPLLKSKEVYMSWVFLYLPENVRIFPNDPPIYYATDILTLGKVYVDLSKNKFNTKQEFKEFIGNLVNNETVNESSFFQPFYKKVPENLDVRKYSEYPTFCNMVLDTQGKNTATLMKDKLIYNTNQQFNKSFMDIVKDIHELWVVLERLERESSQHIRNLCGVNFDLFNDFNTYFNSFDNSVPFQQLDEQTPLIRSYLA